MHVYIYKHIDQLVRPIDSISIMCLFFVSRILKGAPVAHGWNGLHLGLFGDQVLGQQI